MAVVAQGEGGHEQAGSFCQGCEAGEGPVDGEGDQVGNELLGPRRQAADQQSGGVGEVPEPAEPAGAVTCGVIEVEQQGAPGLSSSAQERMAACRGLDLDGLRSVPAGRLAALT